MDDLPYTTADEDPFQVLPPPSAFARPRPTSLLDKWIRQQRAGLAEDTDNDKGASAPAKPSTEPPSRAATPTAAFLAYPDLGKLSLDDVNSVYSYDLVDDDDLPNATVSAPLPARTRTVLRRRRTGDKGDSVATTASGPRSAGTKQTHKGRAARPGRFRNLNLSFRPTSYPMGRASASDDTAAPSSPSPLSLFARSNTPRSAHHARSASLSTLHMPSSYSLALASPSSPTPKNRSPAQPSPAPPSNSKWRPSILDHFSHPSQSSFVPPEAAYTPPRPSLSSGETSMSGNSATKTATTMDSDMPPTPSRPSFLESLRSKNRSSLSIFKSQVGSSTSICSPSRGNFDDIPEAGPSSADPSGLLSPTDPRRMSPFAYSSRGQYDNLLDDDEDLDYDQQHYVASQPLPPPTLPTHHKRESARSSISFSSHFGSIGSKAQRRRKRLVISGVGVHETRKFEGVKRWCENFGEIRQITRVANGDLHIDFRRPEVADTVCRVRAKVFIAGVGSVYLSWTTGDKR